MSNTSIGALSVTLSASASEFMSTLDKAADKAKDWSKSVGKALSFASGSNALGGAGSGVLGGAFGALAGGVGAGSLFAGGKAAFDFVRDTGKEMMAIQRQADTLGLSTRSWVGLLVAAKDR